MPVPPAPVVAVMAGLGLVRLIELALSVRNERLLLARGAQRLARDGFAPIVAVQVALYILVPLEAARAPWSGPRWPLSGLALAAWLAANALRYWSILSLGERWSVRVLRLPGTPLVSRGPYRWLRHPNYVGVVVDLVALPVVFGAFGTALVLGLLNVGAILRRVRLEEQFLGLRPASVRAA